MNRESKERERELDSGDLTTMRVRSIGKVSADIREKILERPTETILKSESEEVRLGYESIKKIKHVKRIKTPKEFNGREVWGDLLSPVMNQGNCGSCWAFASTSVLADCFNIQSRGMMNIRLSPTKLILCDWRGKEIGISHPEEFPDLIARRNVSSIKDSACYGNSLFDAFRYLYLVGTVTEKCLPYDKSLGEHSEYQKVGSFSRPAELPLCYSVTGPIGDMCSNFFINKKTGEEGGDPARFYRAYHLYAIDSDEEEIRQEIYLWGPVATGMKVYPDFYTFDAANEIYEWNGEGPQVGGHAIEIVGWGEEVGKKYWIIKNSWGTEWGDGGYFKMVRGKDDCEIESNVITAAPDFFYPHGVDICCEEVSEPDYMKAMRKRIERDLDITGGGIDPTTGYSRRVMVTMPWIDVTRPVKLEDLPDFSKYVAATDFRRGGTGDESGEWGLMRRGEWDRYTVARRGIIFLSIVVILVSLYFLVR